MRSGTACEYETRRQAGSRCHSLSHLHRLLSEGCLALSCKRRESREISTPGDYDCTRTARSTAHSYRAPDFPHGAELTSRCGTVD